jgi:hypothetical protein
MIIVSGEARSGTSLMMLILKRLGLKIAGSKFITEDNKMMNPTGIWEIKGTPMKPFNQELIDLYEIKGDVMKIISHGLLESDMSLIDLIIYMVRNPREIVVSQRQQVDYIDDEYNYNWYNIHCATLITKLDRGEMSPMMFVHYTDLMTHPKRVTKTIASILGLKWTAKVAKAVNKKYYRSKADDAEPNEVAEVYYQYLKELCV